ncbi:rRNA maturation RNase YbeY [Alkalibacillus aidingensis]|uniref:rRNA maturation RNase YbeY n=1 Tax=Alkalibacillus aidingensis TaxID=2747607 RepID=UPI001660D0AC|nr:rRNA maturation RNase YbeY [Alkalibacillus aidingensis]
MQLELIDETGSVTEQQQNLLKNVLELAAKRESVEPNAEVSLTFITDEEIKEINRDYREKDQVTDVISFALEEHTEDELVVQGEDIPIHYGDIVISIDRAYAQADEYNHSIDRELAFLAVHGLLHLIGYDHQTKEEEQMMFSKQEEILNEYGLKRHEK